MRYRGIEPVRLTVRTPNMKDALLRLLRRRKTKYSKTISRNICDRDKQGAWKTLVTPERPIHFPAEIFCLSIPLLEVWFHRLLIKF